jgi:hypothetical protein
VREIAFKFSRADVQHLLPPGDAVPLTVQGEVADVQWFRGTTLVRTIRKP